MSENKTQGEIHMSNHTRILAVVHDSGQTAHTAGLSAAAQAGTNAILFEVAEGPHAGKRGTDFQLFDLIGPIHWDKSQVVSYETGERRPFPQD